MTIFDAFYNASDERIRGQYRMPSSPRDEVPRRRRKEYDHERESASSREKQRSTTKLSSTKSYRRRSRSRERDYDRDSPRSATSDRIARKTSITVPEMERRPSGTDVRPKTSYPTFSKAHSREAIASRENIATADGSPPTSETADTGKDKVKRRNSTPANGVISIPKRTSPSPAASAEAQDMKRSYSGGSVPTSKAEVKADPERREKNGAGTTSAKAAKGSTSNINIRKAARFADSEVSSMPGAFPEDERRSTPNSGYRATTSTGSQPTSSVTEASHPDSDATSIPEERKSRKPTTISTSQDDLTSLDAGSEPKTPTPSDVAFPHPFPKRTKTPVIEVGRANKYMPSRSTTGSSTSTQDPKTPMTAVPPPPPPPPPLITGNQPAPRVDYLLKNGGLSSLIPKRLVANGPSVQPYSTYQSPSIGQMAPIEDYAKIFGPVHKRLDDYLYVLRHNGSLAVATGYKSVARRLLDKLSQVFARDISSQRCNCVICKTTPQPSLSDEEDIGVSWGEILEFVSGRRELPPWPPFTIKPEDSGLGISGATQKPMQKLDIDVPEEYREHYIRQNQKTKRAVQNWLSQQPEYPSSPPEEADEDTLMFAMMTTLDAQQRSFLIALVHGQTSITTSRAPTPAERPVATADALQKAGRALQRLYRLVGPPRDCESALYLLNNPHLHSMLATLAEVNEQEWEILVSGRFDGFLWSGAEAPFPPSVSRYSSPIPRGPSRGANGGGVPSRFATPSTHFSGISQPPSSRTQTPFSTTHQDQQQAQQNAPAPPFFPARGPPTPALNGTTAAGVTPPPPVQLDEDTELAVLAEVERNLFNDMERFEDAFEILHSRAELVRQLLRERSAGLSMQSSARRGGGSAGGGVGGLGIVRLDTPASANTDFELADAEQDDGDDGLGDLASLAPDDSASQISVQRRRERKRHERRTPAAVAEEDEGEGAGAGWGSLFEEERERRSRFGGGRRSKY